MNKIFRLVWNAALRQPVVTSELAHCSARTPGGSRRSSTGLGMPSRLFAALALAGVASSLHATDVQNGSFESGTLSGWISSTTGTQDATSYGSTGVGASVVTGMTGYDSTNGNQPGLHSWTVTPFGSYMASLQAGPSDTFTAGATALGLSADAQQQVATLLSQNGGNGSPTNAAWIYQDITLQAGQSFTFAWQYISTDYEPYNDASLTSLVNLDNPSSLATVNNLTAEFALLGATNQGTGNYSTGSYGATGWEVSTYLANVAGTYRLGFLSFNLSDTINSPILLIDQQPGQTFDNGVPFAPISPNPGSVAPTTPTSNVIDTSKTSGDIGTGDAVFDGGTLTPQGNDTLGQNFAVTTNGGTIDQAGHDSAFSGVFSDQAAGQPGSVEIVNSGTGGSVTFAAANTYTGGTTIGSGATLALSGSGSIASSSDITADGTLDVAGSSGPAHISTLDGHGMVTLGNNYLVLDQASGQFGGSIGGQGGLVVNAGVESLSGTNSYGGGTYLNGGSLHVGSDASLGAAGGGLDFNGGDLTVTQSMTTGRSISANAGGASLTTPDGVTLQTNGTISGSGGLLKHGGGTLVIHGANSFTGGTLIDGGLVSIDNGASLGSGVIMLSGAGLQTSASLSTAQDLVIGGQSGIQTAAGTSAVLAGTITSSGQVGCFTKSGSGALVLTGSATMSAGTCVQEGLLRANGSLNSWVRVDPAGMLRGIGSVSGDILVNGTLAPGNSPGTLTVNGSVNLSAGSALEIDVDGLGTGTGKGNYSRIILSGSNSVFNAGGTLKPILRGITGNASNTFTPAIGDTFHIVQAQGGVKGQFASLAQPTEGMTANTRFALFYGANAIDMFVVPVSYGQWLQGHADGNAQRVGYLLDTLGSARDANAATPDQAGLLYTIASASQPQLVTLATGLAGEVHAQMAAAAREASLGVTGDVDSHMREAPLTSDPADHGTRVWATTSESGYRVSADAEAPGVHSRLSRTTAGLDIYRGERVLWGFGAAHTDTRLQDTPDSGTIRGNGILAYGEAKAGGALIDGTASWSADQWRSHRSDPLGLAGGLNGSAAGSSVAASLTARFPVSLKAAVVEPYLQSVWQHIQRDGIHEEGDALTGLNVGSFSASGTRLLAGLDLTSVARDPLLSSVTYRLGAALGADFGDALRPTLDASLAGRSFVLKAASPGRAIFKLDASGTLRVSHNAYLYGGLASETGSQRQSYSVSIGIRALF